jgi:adenylylsulfate kinase-like enzyme
MLIILGGLPAAGKTTIARLLASRIGAVHLRIDTIEDAILAARPPDADVGPEGYLIAYGIAQDNLKLGNMVIADCVNAIGLTRNAWRKVAACAGTAFLEIEVVCSDLDEHRRRLEGRTLSQTPGRELSWQDVVDRPYEDWKNCSIRVDTALKSAETIVDDLLTILPIPSCQGS